MTRMGGVEQIEVKPRNNIYTVLAVAAVVVEVIALVALFVRASTLDISLF